MWNEVTPRDSELLRRAATLLRHFGAAPDTPLRTRLFEPFYTAFSFGSQASSTVSVSKFANASSGRALFLMVSNASLTAADELVELELPSASASQRVFYDLYRGVELTPTRTQPCGATRASASARNLARATLPALTCAYVEVRVEARGIGAVLSAPKDGVSRKDFMLLHQMNQLSATPLSNYSSVWRGALKQEMLASPPTQMNASAAKELGMALVALKPQETFTFRAVGSMIEE